MPEESFMMATQKKIKNKKSAKGGFFMGVWPQLLP